MRALHREGLIVVFILVGLIESPRSLAGEGVAILPPDGCLPADGGPPIPVHVYTWGWRDEPGVVTLQMEKGSFTPAQDVGDGLYRSSYLPPRLKEYQKSRLQATWQAGKRKITESLQVFLCPHPVGAIQVRAEPERLIAGEGQQADLHIQVTDPQGRPLSGLPLEITTSVGKIQRLREVSSGTYKAVFLPPDDPFPQVAIIMVANPTVARLDRVAVGRVVIPITARIEIPGRTAPGTKMEITVAGRKFGPQTADKKGRFRLPILVPPGYGTGTATSVDQADNRRTRQINLYLPETNQLGLWGYPGKLPADGKSRSRLLVTTMDRFGVTTDFGGVQITTNSGKVEAIRRISRGLYEAYYTSPTSVRDGVDHLELRFPSGGEKSRARLTIHLRPGPASRVTLKAPELLPADGRSSGKIEVNIQDERGNPVGEQQVILKTSMGNLGSTKETATGHQEALLMVPLDPQYWSIDVQAEVRDRGGETAGYLMVSATSLETDSSGKHYLRAVLVDGTYRPVAGKGVQLEESGRIHQGKTDSFGHVRFRVTGGGEGPHRCLLLTGEGLVRRVVFWVEEKSKVRLLPLDLEPGLPPNESLRASTTIRLHPPSPINLKLEVIPPKRSRGSWLVRANIGLTSGEPAKGRKVAFSASAGTMGPIREVAVGVHEVELHPGAVGWSRIVVSAVESESHVGAVTEITEPGRSR